MFQICDLGQVLSFLFFVKMGSDHHELIQILCKLDEMVCLRSGKCYAYFTKSTTSHHLHRHHPSPCPHHRSPPSLQWPPDSLLVSPPAPQPILNTQSSVQSVQSLRHGQLCDTTGCSMPGFPVHHQLPGLAQNHVHRVGDAISHLILCHPLLLLSLIFPIIRVFSNESVVCIRWPEYWSFNFSISPSNEYSGMISFRVDWLDLLAVQVTFKCFLQHHSSKASILWCSAFFIIHLSHPYMTTGKIIALIKWTFVGKVMSLLFNVLPRRQWHPTPVLLPGKSHGWRSLVGCSPWGR